MCLSESLKEVTRLVKILVISGFRVSEPWILSQKIFFFYKPSANIVSVWFQIVNLKADKSLKKNMLKGINEKQI